MRKWYAIFADDPQKGFRKELVDEDLKELKRFDDADKAGEINGREVIGMWVIDEATEQPDVIKCYGRVPEDILIRYEEVKHRRSRKPPA